MKLINLSDVRSEKYDLNESKTCNPCLICGKDVTKIEEAFESNLERWRNKDPKVMKWYKDNYIHMDTDGNLYFVDENVAEGHESQGCFPVGCSCMKKYKSIRSALS